MTNIALDKVQFAEYNQNQQRFIEVFGSIFEHSPWIAELAWYSRPFSSRSDILSAMTEVLNRASKEQKLDLMKAHPELAGKLAQTGKLTEDSKDEQASAGLNTCSEKELATLTEYNQRYQCKFGFPFIVAVKSMDKYAIIKRFAERLENDEETEFNDALQQIFTIAELRMQNLSL